MGPETGFLLTEPFRLTGTAPLMGSDTGSNFSIDQVNGGGGNGTLCKY